MVKSDDIKGDLGSGSIKLLHQKEYSITFPDSEKPIMGTWSVRGCYAIVIYHKTRTCLLHWDDNINYDQLAFVVNKFLNTDTNEKSVINAILSIKGFKPAHLQIVHDCLDVRPALNIAECQVSVIGGWKDNEESRQSGEFIKEYFKVAGVELLDLTQFQVKKSCITPIDKLSNQEKINSGFRYVTVDSRNGVVRFSDAHSSVDNAIIINMIQPLVEHERSYRYLDLIHLKQAAHAGSGTKLISADYFSEIAAHEALQLCKLSRDGDIKQLKEFLGDMIIDINASPKSAQKWTALHYACASIGSGLSDEHMACAELLISHGASITKKNEKNKAPLELIKNNPEARGRLEARWEIREHLLKAQGNAVALAFSIYYRNPEQVTQKINDSMSTIEDSLKTVEGCNSLKSRLRIMKN